MVLDCARVTCAASLKGTACPLGSETLNSTERDQVIDIQRDNRVFYELYLTSSTTTPVAPSTAPVAVAINRPRTLPGSNTAGAHLAM